MTSLQKNSPVLFQLLSDLDGGIAANELRNVLGQLRSKLREFHDKYSDAVESETTIAPAENATDFSRMDFFPRWPPIRSRGKYKMDVGTLANASESCKKYPSGHPTLLPGIFTVYCSHGKMNTLAG